MPVAVDQDRTACEGQAPGRTRLVTTLYDLITALHESIEPGEEDLVTAAVVHLLHAGHVKFLVTGQRRDMEQHLANLRRKDLLPRLRNGYSIC
jgi:hypothetical protein